MQLGFTLISLSRDDDWWDCHVWRFNQSSISEVSLIDETVTCWGSISHQSVRCTWLVGHPLFITSLLKHSLLAVVMIMSIFGSFWTQLGGFMVQEMDTTTLPGPSQANTRIYSPEHESLYSLRSLGLGQVNTGFHGRGVNSGIHLRRSWWHFYPILADSCYSSSHWLTIVTWVVFTLLNPQYNLYWGLWAKSPQYKYISLPSGPITLQLQLLI